MQVGNQKLAALHLICETSLKISLRHSTPKARRQKPPLSTAKHIKTTLRGFAEFSKIQRKTLLCKDPAPFRVLMTLTVPFSLKCPFLHELSFLCGSNLELEGHKITATGAKGERGLLNCEIPHAELYQMCLSRTQSPPWGKASLLFGVCMGSSGATWHNCPGTATPRADRGRVHEAKFSFRDSSSLHARGKGLYQQLPGDLSKILTVSFSQIWFPVL